MEALCSGNTKQKPKATMTFRKFSQILNTGCHRNGLMSRSNIIISNGGRKVSQVSHHKLFGNNMQHTVFSRSLGYASVNHNNEYKQEIDGAHGEQLQIALREAMKYEHEEVDPFELYEIKEDEDVLIEKDIKMETKQVEASEEGENDDDEEIYEEEEDSYSMYTTDGQPRRTRAELESLKAGAPAGGIFAVIDLNGSQQKVTVDDVIIVNKLKPVDKWAVGSTHTLNASDGQVLLMGSQEKTLVGLPFVNGGEVDVMVEEITRDKKVIIFKKKRRKNYRRKNGFKREVTFLRILDIRFP